MRWIQEKPIIIIPIALLLALLVLPMFDEDSQPKTKHASVAPEKFPSTGFPDYDLLPDKLKQRMEELVKEDTMHRYSFYYFFEVDDVNRHYYIDDYSMNTILISQKAENQEALALVDERLMEDDGRGFSIVRHPQYWDWIKDRAMKEKAFSNKNLVHYVFPEGKADFRDLRVGIFKDTTNYLSMYEDELTHDSKTYGLREVDTPPIPKRGMAYFHEVIRKFLEDKLVYFNFYSMEGLVKAEFTIGGKADSPQIIEGFSTRESELEEAYKLDGLIVKALNDPKVRWKSGVINGKKVNTRVSMDFHFAFNEEGNLTLSMSDLYPATKTF
ncbi:hypothetical protein OKW21_005088 [Catalinimonas alkaloidigena]|uniref:hypothetical protein n=1 Tax=Catalinimonas alkaloidigena TaxID=1075417 RepID=UPI002404D1C4|nr:hypothetical protein [Catalinimonas alkaloidigena]MDF9799825.1 hypothetical protein [Catalinimonas alkaloidigena]